MLLSPEDRILSDFANAIVKQAADDYRNALKGIGYDQQDPEKNNQRGIKVLPFRMV